MKKFLSLILAIILLTLTACTGQTNGKKTDSASENNQSKQGSETVPLPVTSSAGGQAGKILVAYFSRSGNTEQIANSIQAKTGGDLFRIETAERYPENYDDMLAEASEEQGRDARPELADAVEHMNDYTVIFLGYPIWWGEAPMAVLTFLENYDLSGKIVIPFCTYDSSGFGNSVERLKRSAPGSDFLEGFGVESSQAANAGAAVEDWLGRLGFTDN